MKPEDKTGFAKWLAESYLPQDVKDSLSKGIEVVGTAADVVAGITSVVGIVGTVIKLIEFLHFADPGKDPLQIIANAIRDIENLLISTYQHTIDAEWNAALADLTTAAQSLNDFVSDAYVATADRRGLIDDTGRNEIHSTVIGTTRNVVNRLLPPEGAGPPTFQQILNNPQLKYAVDWVPQYYEVMDAAALGVTGLPTIAPFDDLALPQNATVWDYRRALPYIVHAVTQLVSCFRVYDPAFRTTRRFHDDIEQLVESLDIFAARWFNCIYWSHDYPVDATYDPSTYPEAAWPNAVDTRLRASVNHGTEHPEVVVYVPMPANPEYSNRRLEYGRKILTYSGFNDFREWVDLLRPLRDVPHSTESVSADPRVFGTRSFEGTKQLTVGPSHRTVKVFHVDWMIVTDLIVQPQKEPYDYARERPITYEFFLESYEAGPMTPDGSPVDEPPPEQGLVQRVRLRPGLNQRITLRVSSPDVFVPGEDDGSYGEGWDEPTSKFLPPVVGIERSPDVSIVDVVHEVATVADPTKSSGSRFAGVSAIKSDVSTAETVDREQRTAEPIDVANRFFNDLVNVSVVLGDKDIVDRPPPKAFYLNPQETETTIGCSLSFGPDDDIEDGLVRFRAWNLTGEEVNVGSLYLVVHEKPPLDPGIRIKTFLPVPINPTEYWYASYSRTGPHFVPA